MELGREPARLAIRYQSWCHVVPSVHDVAREHMIDMRLGRIEDVSDAGRVFTAAHLGNA